MEVTQEDNAPDCGIAREKNLPYIPSYCFFHLFHTVHCLIVS
jgi:hypothetical protein